MAVKAQKIRKAPRALAVLPAYNATTNVKVHPLVTLTAQETADLIGTTVATLRLWRRQGRGPTHRSDGTYLLAEVSYWMDAHGRLYGLVPRRPGVEIPDPLDLSEAVTECLETVA